MFFFAPEAPPKKKGLILPTRYIVALLGSAGFAICYGLRVNLSVAMVGMLNHTAIRIAEGEGNEKKLFLNIFPPDEDCQPIEGGGSGIEADGPFNWSSEVQGIVLSCYFWGYLVSQLPGGLIAESYSAKWVLFSSVALNVVCTLLTPVICRWHYIGLVVLRVSEGVGGGVVFPATHTLLSRWSPPSERTFMVALTFAGSSLGTVISLLMSGLLTANAGWESVFYVMGGLTLIWCVLWVILVQDSPQQHKLMGDDERQMIINALGKSRVQKNVKLPIPWGAIFTSRAFWTVLVTHVCSNFGWYLLVIQLPFYMKQVLKFNITQVKEIINGSALAVSLPFLSLWMFSLILSRTLDWMRSKNYITTTTARKIGTFCGTSVPATCLIAIGFIGCDRTAAVACMTVGITFVGGMFCGFLSNHIDIAPNFAGTLMAITNTAATLPGIVVPLYVNAITYGNQTMSAWRIIFLISAAVYILELCIYTTFGTTKEQPWNQPRPELIK